MICSWFHKTPLDEAFYKGNLSERLPKRIIDAHVHMNLVEHIKNISDQQIACDWALEVGRHMDYEASMHYYGTIFPEQKVDLVAFPFPLPEVDIKGNNLYLSGLGREKRIQPLMSSRPEWSAEEFEQMLTECKSSGIKPYPYMATSVKGADISIYDFLPEKHLKVIDKYRLPVVLHLPRRGRLPDKDNIRELREIRQRYPDVTIVLPHFGRCFNEKVFRRGLDALGDDKNNFYYDTSAVVNPKVHEMALEELDVSRIMFGTDFPIMTWHGMQEWENDAPTNYAREDFAWNNHEKGRESEEQFTFIVYEQLNNLLNAIGDNKQVINRIFYENAFEIYFIGGKERWKQQKL